MDVLENPEVKKTYDKCKYIVKVWEHKFTKKYKRIPSKLDIREAPVEVRHAYRKYFQLKTAVLEQSFMDVEGFEDEESYDQNQDISDETVFPLQSETSRVSSIENIQENLAENNGKVFIDSENDKIKPVSPQQVTDDVWGSHLNKKKSPNDIDNSKKDSSNLKLTQSISKKLFCGSKFNKRNPRKSLSFSQKKQSEANIESTMFLSQPNPAITLFKSEEVISLLDPDKQTLLMDKTVKIVEPVRTVWSQPLNIIDSIESKQISALKNVDPGWLQRVTEDTGISLENPELSSSQSNLSTFYSFCDNSKTNNEAVDTKLDYDSDDIIEDSDEEQNSRHFSSFHIAKKSRVSIGSMLSRVALCSQPNLGKIVPNELINSTSSLKENITDNIPVPVQKIGTEKSNEVNRPEVVIESKTEDEEISSDNITEKTSNINSQVEVSNNNLKTPSVQEKTLIQQRKKTVKKQWTKSSRKPRSSAKKKLQKSPEVNESNTESPSVRRSTRKNKVKASFEELSSGEEDPFHSDNDDNDPEFILEAEKEKEKKIFDFKDLDKEFNNSTADILKPKQNRKKTEKKSGKTKNSQSTGRKSLNTNKEIGQSEEHAETEDNAKYELEFNVKPRVVAPRFNSIKKVIKQKLDSEKKSQKIQTKDENSQDNALPKDKRQQAREKLEQKMTSGGLNENFVTINLRKKVFVRGKKGHNFSKYKKALWKSKKKALYGPDMDMGGCDGGKLTCFKCGQEGHFAQKCKAEKGDGLLPLEAQEEEECPYPTLEEASQMASESVLSIRKPKLCVLADSKKDGDGINKDNGGEGETDNDNEGNVDNEGSSEEDWCNDIDSELLLAEALKLEEHVKKLDVQVYMDNVKIVKPYYQLQENGTVIETPSEVFDVLTKFGHDSFRQGQDKAIMRILSGKSTLVTLSTGSGKSLCYQLPAFLYSQREPCISLVISPLVSLMEDQVIGIPKFLKAACLHTNQTKTQRQKITEALSMGEINILLISPEAVVAGEKQTGFGSLLRKLPPIAFACIDEAHCVSQWSHNFRPSYLMICRVLRESLGVKTILGLTATATRATCDSIIRSLDIPDGFEGIISDIPLPDNLYLTVSKDVNRERALLNLLLSDRFKSCKSIIVYCTRRDECERIAAFLRTSLKCETVVESTNKKRKRLNLQAEPYHAGLAASRRRSVQNAFMSGDLRVVVATVAFGMGINKSDIRAVIHFNMPNSFESYVQEVGRAGRDGLPAHCHVFLDSQGRDENELRRHIHANSIDRHVIRKLLEKIFIPCSCKGTCPKHEVAFSIEKTIRALDIPEENISTLLCYLELHKNKFIELLNPAYTTCKVVSYGGSLQIRKAAKDCLPLAMALALHKSKSGEDNILEFPVVDVASTMGWESGICKHKLKNLEWTTANNQPKRSTLSVQFSNLGFRLLAPGNLSDEQLDEALDSLYNKVKDQESTAVKQLHAVHKTLLEVAEKTYVACTSSLENPHTSDDSNSNNKLKIKIREYFNSQDPLANIGKDSPKKLNEEQLVNDIRAMICMYRDNQFTGRALARIFHGIQSPNYPAVIWGRCKFWRSHLNEDFNDICRIATKEIIRMR